MSDKLQTNFNIIRLYDENTRPVPVTKVGIVPFVVTSQGYGGGVLHDDLAGEVSRSETGGSVPPMNSALIIKALFMKPRAEARRLGPPAFQIAKGTRRVHINERWCDMREDDLKYADESFHETLLATALREGEEEIGLKPGNIKQLFDMGGFTFTSASRGIAKPIHIFAAEIADTEDFLPFETTTAEVRWMSLAQFSTIGRADHVKIMESLVQRLTQKLSGK